MKCEKCAVNYPNNLVQPFISSEGNYWLCGICARDVKNKMHGLPLDTPFQGEEAQRIYDRCKTFLARRN
jgi:hypothetical protein